MAKRDECKDCKYWKQLAENFGKCSANSQLVNGEYAGMFPLTNDDDSCNHHSKLEPKYNA